MGRFGCIGGRFGCIGGRFGCIGARFGCIGGHVEYIGGRVGLIGGRAGSARVFGYQHVGIGNAKVLHWGYSPTQSPNASGFALQWNIGFRLARGSHICIIRENDIHTNPHKFCMKGKTG